MQVFCKIYEKKKKNSNRIYDFKKLFSFLFDFEHADNRKSFFPLYLVSEKVDVELHPSFKNLFVCINFFLTICLSLFEFFPWWI